MNSFKLTINKNQENRSISSFLADCHLARKKIYLLRDALYVNGIKANQETLLKLNDVLEIDLTSFEKIDFIPSHQMPDVVYEDDYILIISKRPNQIIYPEFKDGTGTVVNDVAYYYKEKGLDRAIRYIHRLDRETSGALLFAKDMITHAYLSYLLEQNKIDRKYIGFVKYSKLPEKGEINQPIGGDRHHSGKMITHPNGQPALTRYRLLAKNEYFSIYEFKLETGRTHQIRVHVASTGNPLLGDTLYGVGSQLINRPALHSSRITFRHPYSGEMLDVKCPMPDDMKSIISEHDAKMLG
jgi:23S rRNA pseudouridine1911/1915/1917 synthase